MVEIEDRVYEKQLKAWEDFHTTGKVDTAVVRKEIAASWVRCRERGLDPYAPKAPVRLSDREMQERIAKNGPMLNAALPFMQLLEISVRATGFITTLSDRDGIVLMVCGDDEILDMSQENNYVPGCCRSEEEVGTNSIGLCLVERRPLHLTGPEHYNRGHHAWTCASSPIFSPRKDLLGVLTLSGKPDRIHPHTFGMVICAAEAIENKLKEESAAHDRHKIGLLLDSILNSISEAIIAVGKDGVITHVNTAVAEIFKLPSCELAGRNARALFSQPHKIDAILQSERETPPTEMSLETTKGRLLFMMECFPIRESGEILGTIVKLKEKRKVLTMVNEVSGFSAKFTFRDIIGKNLLLHRQMELARAAAKTSARVLIIGESGTGKELFAQAIHKESLVSGGPFLAMNCAAIPRELFEAELFGYVEGAFTGARKRGHVGKIELADGGTLFLDEIGYMPIDMQTKLLRVLQEGEITRLGDTRSIKVNVRVISATNRDLFAAVKAKSFRGDLYYRLSVVEIAIPPLRSRIEDLPDLGGHIMKRIASQLGVEEISVSREAMGILMKYAWPGNIRELENVLELAAIVCKNGVIHPGDLPARVRNEGRSVGRPEKITSLKAAEESLIRKALRESRGNVTLASRELKISRSTLYRRLRELGMAKVFGFDEGESHPGGLMD